MTTHIDAKLRTNQSVALSPRGLSDAWGLYVEFTDHNAYGEVTHYTRMFLTGCDVSSYRRARDASRSVWRIDHYETYDAAVDALVKKMLKSRTVMRGGPILVQLENQDIESLRMKRVPSGRYRGNNRHEALYGKFEAGIVPPSTINDRGISETTSMIAGLSRKLTAAPPKSALPKPTRPAPKYTTSVPIVDEDRDEDDEDDDEPY